MIYNLNCQNCVNLKGEGVMTDRGLSIGRIFARVAFCAMALTPIWSAAQSEEQRFLLNGDEASDTSTGLTWRRCAEGEIWNGSACTGVREQFNWKAALERAKSAAVGTKAWRLPNVKELRSLVDQSRINPAIDTVAFPGDSVTFFWSSTHFAGDPAYLYDSWYVSFYEGFVGNIFRDAPMAVRLVRDTE